MKFVGIDFPSLFDRDNFALRRATGNMFDPESLISGKEIHAGMTYRNSTRAWDSEDHYLKAVTGEINTEEILRTAPRVFKTARFFQGVQACVTLLNDRYIARLDAY